MRNFNIAASKLLSEIVVSKLDNCALNRVDLPGDMVERARILGFTAKEAWDIMSGWDGRCWRDSNNDVKAPGYQLGQIARQLVHA